MARSQDVISCPVGVWTELTNSDAISASFQVIDGAIELRATVGAVPPAASARGFLYVNTGVGHREGELDALLSAFAPGATRLYARPGSGRAASVLVSHA
jgi:hypothetical protein